MLDVKGGVLASISVKVVSHLEQMPYRPGNLQRFYMPRAQVQGPVGRVTQFLYLLESLAVASQEARSSVPTQRPRTAQVPYGRGRLRA